MTRKRKSPAKEKSKSNRSGLGPKSSPDNGMAMESRLIITEYLAIEVDNIYNTPNSKI